MSRELAERLEEIGAHTLANMDAIKRYMDSLYALCIEYKVPADRASGLAKHIESAARNLKLLNEKATSEAAALAAEVESMRMQAAACMTACLQNTRESAKARIQRGHAYYTQAYGDVCTAVDREMRERERAETAEAALEKCRADAILNAMLRISRGPS